MAIGKQVKHYREKLKWGQKELSEAAEVDVGTISALEVRDSKSSKYFLPIARAFGLTLEQLANESVDWPIDRMRQGVIDLAHHAAKEASPLYGWPFESVTTEQYNALTTAQRQTIETMILTILHASNSQEKQIAPEKKFASQ